MTSKEYWAELITKFSSSGLSQSAFSKQHNLKLHTFRYWLDKIKSNSQGSSFVKLTSAAPPVSIFEIEYPNGVKLRPQGNPSREDLQFLISLF